MSEVTLTEHQLELADRLTALQRKTVINVIKGMNYTDAYRDAGGKAKNDQTAYANASRMLSDAKVRAFYNALLEQAASDAVMTREEALATLTDIARTGSEAAKTEEDEDGGTITIMRATDRISAIKQMSVMQGWDAPKKHEHSGPDGDQPKLVDSEHLAEAMHEVMQRL